MTQRKHCSECQKKTKTAEVNLQEDFRIHPADVGKWTDLFWAIADIYNTEKHLEFSLMKIKEEMIDEKKDKKLELALQKLLDDVRVLRASLLKKLLEGMSLPYESWCSFKHLAGATMQIMEVATREIHSKNEESAKQYTELAYKSWYLFWKLYFLMKYYDVDENIFEKLAEEIIDGVEREDK